MKFIFESRHAGELPSAPPAEVSARKKEKPSDMSILFSDTIFGPVQSRRLGASLGVNLLPTESKFCNFNCIYCECGWTLNAARPLLPQREDVARALAARLQALRGEGRAVDAITFAGNGEPTVHPAFPEIIDDTLRARDTFYPSAKVVVLSNATQLHKPSVVQALKRVDQAALKLDSAFDDTVRLIDGPLMRLSVQRTVELMRQFDGQFTLQTLFLCGEYQGQKVDNTTPRELDAWLKVVESLRPRAVMVYTIDRETPASGLTKVSLEELQSIARRVQALGCVPIVSG